MTGQTDSSFDDHECLYQIPGQPNYLLLASKVAELLWPITLNIPAHQKKNRLWSKFGPVLVYSVDMWLCYGLSVAQIQQNRTEIDHITATIPCGLWAR